MTIKQQGGVFGRNPTFNDVNVSNLETGGMVSTGNVFVGKSAFDGGLTKGISAMSSGYLVLARDNGLPLRVNRITSNGDLIAFAKDSSTIGSIKADASGNLVFAPGNGGGIDFSATSGTGTSELFDDYEEGTWTPVVAEASVGGTVATGTFTGTYTKIGRLVTVNATLVDITTSGMTAGNILYLRGLPFATGTGHIGSNMMRSVTYSGQIAPRTLDGQSFLYFYQYSTGGAVTPLTIGGISSGVADIWFTVTYEV